MKKNLSDYKSSDIIWIKNVNNPEIGNAYMDLGSDEFPLHFPNGVSKKNLLSPKVDEIMLIRQKIDGVPAFTHLVTPIDNEPRDTDPKVQKANYRYARQVKVIAKTDLTNFIPVPSTKWAKVKSYGNVCKIKKFESIIDVNELQIDIWRRFKFIIINKDETEQNEIVDEFIRQKKTKGEILAELQNLKDSNAEQATVNGKRYKRDNITIAKIKILRDFKCQICSKTIFKKDGSNYIEAAHITPKHLKGRESLDNILILCPNHHKEFDLGDIEPVTRTKNSIVFYLDKKKYTLILDK